MTAALIWSTLSIINAVYSKLLRYPMPLKIDPKAEAH